MFRAHPTSYPTGGLQSQCFTIPYATAYCPPMTDLQLFIVYTNIMNISTVREESINVFLFRWADLREDFK